MKYNYSLDSPAVTNRNTHGRNSKCQEKPLNTRDNVSFWNKSLHEKGNDYDYNLLHNKVYLKQQNRHLNSCF